MAVSTTQVRLRNGAVVSRAFLDVVMLELHHLRKSSPTLLASLLDCCQHNRQLSISDRAGLKDWFYVPRGQSIHPSIRSVVLASVHEEDGVLSVRNPLAVENAA